MPSCLLNFQVNWVGSKSLLTEIVHRLPCGVSAKNQYFETVKTECFALVQQPRDVRHCLLQWGSEIQTCLDLKWSKRGWFANGPDLEWDLKS